MHLTEQDVALDPTQRLSVRKALAQLTGNKPASPRESRSWFQLFCYVADVLAEYQTNLELQMARDTSNLQARKDIENFEDEILSQLLSVRVQLMSIYLSSPWQTSMHPDDRGRLRRDFNRRLATSQSALTSLQLEENAMIRKYREFSQSARTIFLGREVPLSIAVGKLSDRSEVIREQAYQAYWNFVRDHKEKFKGIFLELAANRNAQAKIAGTNGYEDFVYLDMGRIDFDPQASRNLCQHIMTHIVPIISRLSERQQKHFEAPRSKKVSPWNARVWQRHFPQSAPSHGDRKRFISSFRESVGSLHPAFLSCFDAMQSSESFDLFPRENKAPGAFCAMRPVSGIPFVFGNFSVSLKDLFTVFHEFGHAVHGHCSSAIENSLLRSPGIEFCEFVSTTFEFLSHDVLGTFWDSETDADDAARFHLFHSLAFLPFAAQIDEWQRQVYKTPDQAENIWSNLNEMYRPYLDWSQDTDNSIPSQSLGWCSRPHVFTSPFYYIDYAIAQIGAWQIYGKTRKGAPNREESIAKFVATLGLGGQRSTLELFEAAGCDNPFLGSTVAKVAMIIEETFADF